MMHSPFKFVRSELPCVTERLEWFERLEPRREKASTPSIGDLSRLLLASENNVAVGAMMKKCFD